MAANAQRSVWPSMRRKCFSVSTQADATQRCTMSASRHRVTLWVRRSTPPCGLSTAGRRHRAILALLLGCGLRRGEVANLDVKALQQREDHWAVVDLVGKGRHIRTVPIPDWVKAAVDNWTTAAAITEGRLFRCVSRYGSVWGNGITDKVIWHAVKQCGKAAGMQHL